MAKVTEGYMPYLGFHTYWRVVGDLAAAHEEGVEPLVLLHGGPGSAHDYFEVLDDLADRSTGNGDGSVVEHDEHPYERQSPLSARPLVMYDQLGCGRSYVEGHPELWHAETWIGELSALLAHLGIERYHLLGQSWGGMLAIQFACDKKPAGMRSLILSSTLSDAQLWGREQRRLVAALPEEAREAIARADRTGDYDAPDVQAATAEYMQRHACDQEPAPDAPDCVRRPVRKGRESYEVAWGPNEFTPLGNLRNWNYTDRLREVGAPILVISGSSDLCTPRVAQTMFEASENARWELIPGARHMCFVEAHDAYVRLVRAWCAQHD